MTRYAPLLLGLSVLAACARTGAPPPPQESRATLSGVSAQDSNFALQASRDGHFVLRSSALAADRARRPAVRGFAASENKAFTDMLGRLAALPAAGQVAFSDQLAPDRQDILARLGTERAGFDAAFVSSQVETLRKAVEAYQAEYVSGRDAELKAFAQSALPGLKAQLAAARRLHGG